MQKSPNFTAMQVVRGRMCWMCVIFMKCDWNGKKHLYFKPGAQDSSSACVTAQGDDSVRQLYVIPAVLNHVSGGTVQAVRTQNESEVHRPDRTTTGNRGKLHNIECQAEHITEAQLHWADLDFPTHGDIFQQVWA